LRSYTVVRGDTLSGIGAKFHVNWHEIAELNSVKNPDLIYPGQVFKIPNS
jgi:nucleoid-associated protein YgaU